MSTKSRMLRIAEQLDHSGFHAEADEMVKLATRWDAQGQPWNATDVAGEAMGSALKAFSPYISKPLQDLLGEPAIRSSVEKYKTALDPTKNKIREGYMNDQSPIEMSTGIATSGENNEYLRGGKNDLEYGTMYSKVENPSLLQAAVSSGLVSALKQFGYDISGDSKALEALAKLPFGSAHRGNVGKFAIDPATGRSG